MADDLSVETFRPRVGEVFLFRLDDKRELELTLAGVEEAPPEARKSAEAAGLRQPFSVEFRGPLDPVLPQRTYAVRHEEIGAFELFIVPIGRDEQGTQYEAVFG